MKYLLSILILAFSTATFADTPLLTKFSHNGYKKVENRVSETCEVFQDSITISRTVGKINTEQTIEIEISGIEQLAEAASLEVTTEYANEVCDLPQTTIDAGKGLTLYATGGCGKAKVIRMGKNTKNLIRFISKFCPISY